MKLSTFIGNPGYLAGAYVLLTNTFLITTHFSPRKDRQDFAQLYVYVLIFAGLDLFKKQMGWEFPLPLIGLAFNAYRPQTQPTITTSSDEFVLSSDSEESGSESDDDISTDDEVLFA